MEKYNPYEILGVGVNADVDEVKRKYKELVLHLHPDKGVKMEDEYRVEMFQAIRTAYLTILKKHKVKDAPLEKLEYTIDDDLIIQKRDDFIKGSSKQKINKKWDTVFRDIQNELDKEDPEKRGYNEFNTKHDTKSPVQHREYIHNDLFDNDNSMNFIPPIQAIQSNDNHAITTKNEGLLGLAVIDDMSIIQKDNIVGSDLKQAFTNVNSEHFYNKYKDEFENKDIDQMLEDTLNERNVHLEPANQEQVEIQDEIQLKLDLERMKIQQLKDQKKAKVIRHIVIRHILNHEN